MEALALVLALLAFPLPAEPGCWLLWVAPATHQAGVGNPAIETAAGCLDFAERHELPGITRHALWIPDPAAGRVPAGDGCNWCQDLGGGVLSCRRQLRRCRLFRRLLERERLRRERPLHDLRLLLRRGGRPMSVTGPELRKGVIIFVGCPPHRRMGLLRRVKWAALGLLRRIRILRPGEPPF